jgi:hypothetical protein
VRTRLEKETIVIEFKFVVNPPDNRVHLLAVDEDNPTIDVTICGESPGSLEGEWADMVRGQAGLYPVPVSKICMKCFPNLTQFQEEEVPLLLDV